MGFDRLTKDGANRVEWISKCYERPGTIIHSAEKTHTGIGMRQNIWNPQSPD